MELRVLLSARSSPLQWISTLLADSLKYQAVIIISMGVYILLFEVCIIILYGIFIRSTSSFTVVADFTNALYFTLAYTIVNLKYRMLDWSALANYLFILAVCVQLNTLYTIFWISAFKNSFQSTANVDASTIVIDVQCTLAVLVTAFQFMGRLGTVQIFVLCMVELFTFALTFSISLLGIQAVTSGGGVNIFLFAFIFAIPIRKLVCPYEESKEKQRYFTLTLKLIGLVVLIIQWPSFNSITASVDALYLTNIYSTALLTQQATVQTFLGFLSCISTTIGLCIYGQKIQIDKFIKYILNTGILLSAQASLIIDPFASLFMGLLGPLLCFLIEKYAANFLLPGYSIDSIIMAVLSAIFSSIFAAGRNGRTPGLSANPYTQGGLQLASLIVTAIIAFIFGLIAALILRSLSPKDDLLRDNNAWALDEDILPLYSDDPIFKKLFDKDLSQTIKQENAIFNLKESFIANQTRKNVELGKIIKQQLEYESRLR